MLKELNKILKWGKGILKQADDKRTGYLSEPQVQYIEGYKQGVSVVLDELQRVLEAEKTRQKLAKLEQQKPAITINIP
jgi:hypothetical protein